MGIEGHDLGVARVMAGQAADEAPMTDHRDMLPVAERRCLCAERGAALQHILARLHLGPPHLGDMAEVQPRPAWCELADRRADIAVVAGMLMHDQFDLDWQIERLGDDRGGLQRARERAADQSPDRLVTAAQVFRSAAHLLMADRRQFRVGDAGALAGAVDGGVELGLAVADQNHGWEGSCLWSITGASGSTTEYSPSMTSARAAGGAELNCTVWTWASKCRATRRSI